MRAGREMGIAAVVKLLKLETASDGLLESACIALGEMCFGNVDNTSKAVNGEKGIVAMVKILRRETASEIVTASTCRALASMCLKDDDKQSRAQQGCSCSGGLGVGDKEISEIANLILQYI